MRVFCWRAALAAALMLVTFGCASESARLRMQAAPPAPPPVAVQPRPGHVYVQGHWHQVDGKWQWSEGYWVPEKPGYVWVDGQWVDAGGYWKWQWGHWVPAPDSEEKRPGL